MPAGGVEAQGPFEISVEPRSQTFGRYRIVEVLGAGGMAEVFLAKLEGIEGFERKLAIKRILPHHSKNDSFVRMFIDEARLVGHFSHPNIVQTYDFGKIDESYYISMEYVEGVNLAEIMTRHKATNREIPLPAIIEIGIQICRGIDYAHRETDESGKPLGIIHRDLTPHNILVSRKGVVKITDFGIAKASMNTHMTQAGMIKGKVPYMSPEQATGLPLTHVSDIFSIAIVMYEMVTLERLFEGDNDFATLRKVQEAVVPSILAKKPNVPPELERIIFKGLARDRENRYQWASEMEAELTRLKFELGTDFARFNIAEFFETLYVEKEARAKEVAARVAQPRVQSYPPASGPNPDMDKNLRELANGLNDVPDVLPIPGTAGSSADDDSKRTMLLPAPPLDRPSVSSGELSSSPILPTPTPDIRRGGSQPRPVPSEKEAAPGSSRKLFAGLGAIVVLLLVVGGGLFYWFNHRTGTVVVEAIPPDAEIYFNDEKVGSKSPFEKTDIPSGERIKITVRKKGFEDYHYTLEVGAGKRIRLPVTLEEAEPEYGFLNIQSTPSGAKVFLGGHPTNWVTPCRLQLASGTEYQISLQLQGYKQVAKPYSVAASENKSITIPLEPDGPPPAATPAPTGKPPRRRGPK